MSNIIPENHSVIIIDARNNVIYRMPIPHGIHQTENLSGFLIIGSAQQMQAIQMEISSGMSEADEVTIEVQELVNHYFGIE